MVSTTNETVSSFTDLISKLNTWMAANGWTSEELDVTATATTGGEWAMRRTSGATNLRFAANWDGENGPTYLGIYQYVDQNYDTSIRPWEQDNDSGNGFDGKDDADIATSRHAYIGTTPIQYWAFEGDHYTYVVVETSAGTYAHFGFGMLDKRGDWTGGEFVYGQKNSGSTGASQATRDGASYLLDGLLNDTSDVGDTSNDTELFAATVHCEGMPNQVANGQWAVCMGGKDASPQTDFGLDRQSNDGVTADTARALFTWGYRSGPWANGIYRASGTDLSGEVRLWPVGPTYIDSAGDMYGTPVGFMPEVFGCNIKNYDAGDVLTDDNGNEYYLFPARKKYSGAGAETGTSGYLGIAYRMADPGLPAGADSPTGWWSTRSSNDYTLSGTEITQLNDKSGNGNHFTVPGGKTGPDIVSVDGRNWADFPVAGGRVMSATNTDIDPDGGDFTFVAVYRAVDSGTGPGAIFGKKDPANPNYGIFVGVSNSRSLYFQCRDTVIGNTGTVEHDDAGTDYSDGTSRMVCVTYDDSLADLYLYGDSFTSAVDSDLVYASVSITPAVSVFLGDWSSDYDRRHEGEIAELICYDTVLSGAVRLLLETYLKEKWGV